MGRRRDAIVVSTMLAFVALAGGCAHPLAGGDPADAAPAASCVEEYNPENVATRAFAFDGTVTGIGRHQNDGYVRVSFAVNQWFQGADRSTVTIDMAPPSSKAYETSVHGGPYEVGSRLLVSGQPRWGGHPLKAALAWGCGFTRLYDQATADAWPSAERQRVDAHGQPSTSTSPTVKSSAPPAEIQGTALAMTWRKITSQSWSRIARPTYSLSVAPDRDRLVVGVPATMPSADVARLKAIDPQHLDVVNAELRRN
jgi:hypothetical protein